MQKKNKQNNPLAVCMLAVLCAVIVSTVLIVIVLSVSKADKNIPVGNTQGSITEPTETTKPEEPYVVSTATVGSAGDVLIHIPILNSGKLSDGSFNFDSIFTYSSSLITECDYFIANLETTLGGTENGRAYTGYPCFNSPDAIVTSLKKAGVDCLLTANNHTYDTGTSGVQRTLSVVKNAGLAALGTRSNEAEKKYLTENINGINFGFACFTYETDTASAVKALNGINVNSETAKLINSFNYNKLDEFYSEVQKQLQGMEDEGAEVKVVYLHWGNEYQTYTNSFQQKIAQKLCDMGVDVIVGGHPHVVQPVELITSSDGTHKTVCVYSLGNMVSNQRRAYMSLTTGHTEDGLIFLMSFSKYSDGTVTFDSVESVATWVHMYKLGGKTVYNVLPLSENINAAALGLNNSSNGLSLAGGSYDRTMALVKEGTKECNAYLASLKNEVGQTQPITE